MSHFVSYKGNVVVWGASLAVFGLGGGPRWSQMVDIASLGTKEIGLHDREIAYEILL